MEEIWVLGYMEDGDWKSDLGHVYSEEGDAQEVVDNLAKDEGAQPVARKFTAIVDCDLTPAEAD